MVMTKLALIIEGPIINTGPLRTEQRPDLRRWARARALGGQDDHGNGRRRPREIQITVRRTAALPPQLAAYFGQLAVFTFTIHVGQREARVSAPPLIVVH